MALHVSIGLNILRCSLCDVTLFRKNLWMSYKIFTRAVNMIKSLYTVAYLNCNTRKQWSEKRRYRVKGRSGWDMQMKLCIKEKLWKVRICSEYRVRTRIRKRNAYQQVLEFDRGRGHSLLGVWFIALWYRQSC